MKINFVLASLNLCGGVKVIFEYANLLSRKGHEIIITYSEMTLKPDTFRDYISYYKKTVSGLLQKSKAQENLRPVWFDLEEDVKIIKVPNASNKNIPDADIVIVTWWELSLWMKEYSAS